MIVTKIEPVTKKKCRILTDEQAAFVLYKGEVAGFHLEENKELPQEVFIQIQQEILIKRAKLRAMRLLTRMDYTEQQLRRKLEQGEYTETAVDAAIEYVRAYHYLDDERYVLRYLTGQRGNKSRRQMEFELEKKGISREMIAVCKERIPEEEQTDERELIRSLLEKRCRTPLDADEKEKRRHYGYLMRKGFQSSEISSVFREYFDEFERFS